MIFLLLVVKILYTLGANKQRRKEDAIAPQPLKIHLEIINSWQ
ncbi:hypothetical protein [Nodularia sp. UHCC 0506]|nr:hypothetical protein [Nodularia sp. UHCC 0506]MEA5515008.1 hypothetical protein [Nodularia sp. UHCC 0506]